MGDQPNLIFNHLIVDGSFLLYSSIPYKPETDVGPHMATYVFLKRIVEWVDRLHVDAVTVAWDSGVPERRRLAVPTYKAGRRGQSEEQENRRNLVKLNVEFIRNHILPHAAIRSAAVNGLEADDVIYGLCQVSPRKVHVLSLDMDLSQLVTDNVSLVRPGKETITSTSIRGHCLDVVKDFNVFPRTPSDVVLFKALRGDPSDSIKPVVRPKQLAQIWTHMISRGVNPSPESIRSLSRELGIELPAQFEQNYNAVDLVRSGVAGDAIAAAIATLNTRPSFNENDLFSAFASTGMNPGYLHPFTGVLQLLAR